MNRFIISQWNRFEIFFCSFLISWHPNCRITKETACTHSRSLKDPFIIVKWSSLHFRINSLQILMRSLMGGHPCPPKQSIGRSGEVIYSNNIPHVVWTRLLNTTAILGMGFLCQPTSFCQPNIPQLSNSRRAKSYSDSHDRAYYGATPSETNMAAFDATVCGN